jgi:predicted nucleotidyltransferase
MLNFRIFIEQTTLEYHQELNPVFWKKQKFNEEAKKQLLEIAEYWREAALIPKKAVKDILLVGGNANFNYTELSDLDIHLYVDKKLIPDCEAVILDEYLKDKKTLWGLTHDIKIFGFPVEVYAQGLDEKFTKDQGVYSLKKDKWIQEPRKVKVNLQDRHIQIKVNNLKHQIDYYIDNHVDNLAILKNFKEKIRLMRQAAVKKNGEFSFENLVFKDLRNQGYIDKFSDYILSVEDKVFTLNKGEKWKKTSAPSRKKT